MASINRPMIAVIGSGENEHPNLSIPLGRWLAENGYNLINGGGGGVMISTAKAFSSVKKREGLVIGVIPSSSNCSLEAGRRSYTSPQNYPNPYTEVVIRTHLHLSGSMGKELASRNHIIILSADKIIALPGGHGTQSEVELATEYKKPLILLSPSGEWNNYGNQISLVKTVKEATEKI